MQNINDIIVKVTMCIDYQTLYALEDDFNNVGLTIQTTSNNRVTLCKLVDGKPKTSKAVDEFIYIGSLETATNEISPNASEKIIAFIRMHNGKAGKIENKAREWKNGVRVYGKAIRIGEDKDDEAIIEEKTKGYPITEG